MILVTDQHRFEAETTSRLILALWVPSTASNDEVKYERKRNHENHEVGDPNPDDRHGAVPDLAQSVLGFAVGDVSGL